MHMHCQVACMGPPFIAALYGTYWLIIGHLLAIHPDTHMIKPGLHILLLSPFRFRIGTAPRHPRWSHSCHLSVFPGAFCTRHDSVYAQRRLFHCHVRDPCVRLSFCCAQTLSTARTRSYGCGLLKSTCEHRPGHAAGCGHLLDAISTHGPQSDSRTRVCTSRPVTWVQSRVTKGFGVRVQYAIAARQRHCALTMIARLKCSVAVHGYFMCQIAAALSGRWKPKHALNSSHSGLIRQSSGHPVQALVIADHSIMIIRPVKRSLRNVT